MGGESVTEPLSTSRDKNWELLHSLWIGWTFTLGFFSWVAFVYIGLRTRHPRWVFWGLLYATPLIPFSVLVNTAPTSWTNLMLSASVVLGVVSIVHAFLVRREYLLRLDLLQQEKSNVSVTSRGRRWELLHSLWIGWTFTLGILSWIAFVYIGLRVRRTRWILWGLVYLAVFIVFAVTSPESEIGQASTGLMIVFGIVSIVHAFMVRNDYLVRLENRMQEAAEEETSTRRGVQEIYRPQAGEPPASESSEQPTPASSSATDADASESGTPERAAESPPTAVPALARVEANINFDFQAEGPLQISSISESYPLPLAYTWSLLAGLWDPRERYREQLRHAENMLAFLGSVSLALLDEGDYKESKIDLEEAWQGGISFGVWKLIVQLSSKSLQYKDDPLASAIHALNIGSEKKSFGADVAALISARNDFHHGRGPLTEEEIAIASNEAQERLQRCMEVLAFLTRYPIRLVQDFDVDRRSAAILLKCLRLMGDGPGFPQERVEFPRALPRGDLLMDLGSQNWLPLYPFVTASNCSRCRYRETFFIDQWKVRKGTVLMKSFERGHTEERKDISSALIALASFWCETASAG